MTNKYGLMPSEGGIDEASIAHCNAEHRLLSAPQKSRTAMGVIWSQDAPRPNAGTIWKGETQIKIGNANLRRTAT